MVDASLGEVFRVVAARGGYRDRGPADAYVAGRLGRMRLPAGLADESVPADRGEADALGARHRVFAWALWMLVEEHRAGGAPPQGAWPSPGPGPRATPRGPPG
jgi:hypothetical protein